MQKKRNWSLVTNRVLHKFWKIMRLSVFMVFFFVAQAYSTVTYSQQKLLTLKMQGSKVIDVLNKIEEESEFFFLFNQKLLDVERQVNVDVKDESIGNILSEIFEKTNVSYLIKDRQIILTTATGSFESDQQQKPVSGKVTDFSGATLPGVSVVVKGTTAGVITDANGNYSLANFPENSTLQFSFMGMKTQEIVIGSARTINVILIEDVVGIEEVVAIGYGNQRKINLTGSISTLKSEELVKVPVSSATNALAGKLPGLIAIQSSGQPGGDAANLSIRGFGNLLTIVDGVETDFKNIDASQIENVTILKDGAASIYGARAGNGVILVNTKRGTIGKPTITFNATTTLQQPTYFQKMLNSGQYTTLLSEGHLQSGLPVSTVPYTPEQINKYYAATEPGYYNTDWSSLILRDYAPMQQYNLSLRGGSEKIKYYAFLGTLNQGSFWKKNGGDYNRYNFQSNVDAQVLDNLTMGVTVSSIVDDINSTNRPQNGGGYLFADLYNNKPMYPSSLPDPTKIPYSGSSTGGALVQSNRDLGGYSDDDFQTLSGSLTINYDVESVKGLSFKAFGNYMQVAHQLKSFARPVDLYTYNVDTKQYALASQYSSDSPLFQQKTESTSMTSQFSANYKRTFDEVHELSAMALYEIYTFKTDYISARRSNFTFPTLDQMFAGGANTMSNDGSASEMGRASYVGRLNYGYKGKYLTELILRADASAKFPPESRWGYFPGISLGWRIGEEDFMKSIKNLNELKLRASYGASGYDGIGNFQYLAGYGPTLMPSLFGGIPVMGIAARGMANPTLSWEKLAIYNVGLDYSFFNRKLYGEADVFYRERTGIPAQRTVSLPSSFGIELPLENLNSQNNRGFELKIGTAGKSNNLKWDVSANASWQRAKWGHVEEIAYTDPDSKRIYELSGKWVDRTFGYLTDGLFTSQDQISNLTFTYPGDPQLKPGDVRFVNTNEDEVLDWKDMVEIGKAQVPNWMGGLNINLNYRSFDLSALFQGAFGFYKFVSLGSFTQTFFDNRWNEATNDANALIPRLGGAGPNGLLSDRNYKKADYIRLKTVSWGYTLPKRILQKANIQSTRFFIAGSNILTFSGLNQYDIDPESPFSLQDGQPTTSYYPQQKTIMLGVNISL